VRDYGIDGFRVDTAKHVEQAAWQQLKTQATEALAEWKKPIRIKRWITRRSG
jgi:alpha-amylase